MVEDSLRNRCTDHLSPCNLPMIIEAIFILLIVVVCLVHAWWFSRNIPTGVWFHFLFAMAYVVPMIWIGWFWQHNIWLVVALVALRFVLYNPLLNLMRDKPFFYLSVNNSNPSWWDSLEIHWSNLYPYIWAGSIVGFIILQFMI